MDRETAEDVIRAVVLPKLSGMRKTSAGWDARCPAHEDQRASLSIGWTDRGMVGLFCHAGCSQDEVLKALELKGSDLRELQSARNGARNARRDPIVATYDYVDANGDLLFQVCRTSGKKFWQRVPDRSDPSGWRNRLGETRRVIYRLPKVLEAVHVGEQVIYVVEGEKDVQSAERAGLVATCNPMGAGAWPGNSYEDSLAGGNVCVIADRDKTGRSHARQVAACLEGVAASVQIAEPAAGKDLTDHLEAGLEVKDLVTTWTPGSGALVELAPDLHEFLSGVDAPPKWVVDGVLEEGDRLIWTGREGLGKTMVTRQLAVGAAAGLHPFTMLFCEPVSVLFIDCENPQRISRLHFRILREVTEFHQRPVPNGGLRIIHRPEGCNFLREEDAAWFAERITAHKPQLLIMGPLYKLHTSDMNEETSARALISVVDAARASQGCAVVIEAHAPHGEAGRRPIRPAGSSLLLRWPEFGLGILPAEKDEDARDMRRVKVRHWRGPRDQRAWPYELQWGRTPEFWPWMPTGVLAES